MTTPRPLPTTAEEASGQPSGRLGDATELPPRRPLLRRLGALQTLDGHSTQRVARRERAYRRSLAATDLVSTVIACVLSVDVFGDDRLTPWALVLLPLVILMSKLLGLYDRDELLIRKTTADEVPALLQLATAFALGLWLGGDTFVDGSLSRIQVVGILGILLVTMVAGRWLVRGLLSRSLTPERCLVVGGPDDTRRFDEKLSTNPINAQVVGGLVLEEWRTGTKPNETRRARLGATLRRLEVDRVLVVPSDDEPELTLELIRSVKSYGVRVSVLPHVLEAVGSAVAYDDIFGMPVLGVRRFGLTRSSRVLKRTIDIACSSFLLIVLAPVMAVVAVLIKLDSRGPILFRQDRMGRDGERFRMLKFRTMVRDAEARKGELLARNETQGLFKIADDPRITRVGRLLRTTSMDELPQLINVLRGDMSMVGPRPLVLDEDAMIQGLDRRRLDLTPGITGPWQILGSGKVPLSEMVQIDYLYAANWSSWGDVKILMRTVIYVLRRGGL